LVRRDGRSGAERLDVRLGARAGTLLRLSSLEFSSLLIEKKKPISRWRRALALANMAKDFCASRWSKTSSASSGGAQSAALLRRADHQLHNIAPKVIRA